MTTAVRWLRSVLAAVVVGMAGWSPAGAVVIDWVAIGNPGNPNHPSEGFGAVPTPYRISKHEITNSQYAEFLNAVAATDTNGLYNTSMGIGSGAAILRSESSGSFVYTLVAGAENRPVRFVSFFDAARFANWLHNDQPTGAQDNSTTEAGAYPVAAGGFFVRNPLAQIYIPTRNEWYKAAYYDPVSLAYFSSPLGNNLNPICAVPGATPNTANCSNVAGSVSDVGAYTGSPSAYGTFDQGGNVAEWTETLISGARRGRRGGGFGSFAFNLTATSFDLETQTNEESDLGFRVATGPEPGATAQEFFTIDPAQSSLDLAITSGFTLDFMGAVMAVELPLESQVGAGGIGTNTNGLSTSLSGNLLVDIPSGGALSTIEIVNRRSSVVLADSGSWLPGPPGNEGVATPGVLAANIGSAAYSFAISAVVRGAEFSLGHSGFPELLSDQGSGVSTFPLGYGTNNLVAAPVDGVLDGDTSVGVPGNLGGGRVSLAFSVADIPPMVIGMGVLTEQPGGGRQLAMPIDVSVILTDDTFAAGLPIEVRLDLTGQLVASNALFVPEPQSVAGWGVALATLATLRRARRS